MSFLDLLAEADPNAMVGKQTADELRKEITIRKAESKAAEALAAAESTKNDLEAVTDAIITNHARNQLHNSEPSHQPLSDPTAQATPCTEIDENYDHTNENANTAPALPKHKDANASTVISSSSSFAISSNHRHSTNGKKRAAEDETATKNSKPKTDHRVDDMIVAEIRTTVCSSELTAPELYNEYHEAKDGTPNRPRKKTGRIRRREVSSTMNNAETEQVSLGAIVEDSEGSPNIDQVVISNPVFDGTANSADTIAEANVDPRETKQVARDAKVHDTAANGEAIKPGLPACEPETQVVVVDRTEPYGMAPADQYVFSPLRNIFTPSDISTELSSDDFSETSTVIYYFDH